MNLTNTIMNESTKIPNDRIIHTPKEIQPVHSEGDQPWDFFGRNDAKAETPVLWPPHLKSWLIGKDLDAGRDCGQEEKGTTEGKMAGWHRWKWVCMNSGRWCWTGRPGMLWFMGSQGVEHDWATELNWTLIWIFWLPKIVFLLLWNKGPLMMYFHILDYNLS